VKEWGSYRWQEWRTSKGRGCDEQRNRWVRDSETGMRFTE